MKYFFYKLVLSYDGTNYYGYQKQPQVVTIQQTFEKILQIMTNQKIDTYAASRTDKGVHAEGQTIHFKTPFFLEPKYFQNTLNHLLPPDIRVLKMQKTDSFFHARYSAKSKIYHYVFAKRPLHSFNCRFQIFIACLDFEKIKKAMILIRGRHNFAAFTNEKQHKSFFKTMLHTSVRETNQKYILLFHADGFLKYMARFLVGSLIAIGKKKMSLACFETMLNGRTNIKTSFLAPAKGLVLKKILYK